VFKPELCDLCGDCLVDCMFNEYSREEAVAERRALMAGEWAPILHDCASCHACNEFCPQGANPWDLVSKLQSVYGEVTTANVWGERALRVDDARRGLPADPLPEQSDVVLATCTVGDLNPGAFDSLLYAGLTALTGPEYYCCNALEYFGDEEGSRALAQGFVDALSRHQPKEVICYHDACFFHLTYRLPEYGVQVPFRPVHLFEYLLHFVRANPGKVRPLGMRIAYQRPCSSRNAEDKEPFLDELLAAIGCERVPRRYDRANALCCGDVFNFRGLEDRAEEAALRNINDARGHGANAMIYLCPSCLKLYGRLCPKRGLAVYHVSELCQLALGEQVAGQSAAHVLPELPR
jgi:Fe-S oxidoreductase